MDKKQQLVLDELRRHGNVSRASKASGVSRPMIYRWRQQDRVFGAAMNAALEEGRREIA